MSNWFIYYLLFIFVFWMLFRNKKETNKHIEARIKRRRGDTQMQELAKRFILKEVVDNAVVIDRNGAESVVNLDYVIRLREYPTNKNGKRKTVIAD